MELNELIENVQQWSIDRGLDKADSKKQLLKLYEEFGELASGIAKNQPEVIMDSIGDCVVVLIILAQQMEIEELDIERHELRLESIFSAVEMINGLTLRISSLNHYDKDDIQKLIESLMVNFRYASRVYDFIFEDCLEMAWNAIKDRKGKLVDGVWVKEEDLKAKVDEILTEKIVANRDFTELGLKCASPSKHATSPEQTLEAVIEADMVMNPNHYQGSNGLQAMEVLRQFAPCPEYIEGGYWFNTLKYLLRHHKKNGVQDLKKGLRNLVWFISCLSDKQELAGLLMEMAKELDDGATELHK